MPIYEARKGSKMDGVIYARLYYNTLLCPRCHCAMKRVPSNKEDADVVSCDYEHCPLYGLLFEQPRIPLRRAKEKSTVQRIVDRFAVVKINAHL